MNKSLLKKIAAWGAVDIGAFMATAGAALAVTTENTGLDESAQMVYGHVGGKDDLAMTIGTIINGFLALLGIVFVVLVIYGGVLWMTARGNQETLKKAQGTLTGAAIGFILIMSAYAISDFVIKAIVNATVSSSAVTQPPPANDPT